MTTVPVQVKTADSRHFGARTRSTYPCPSLFQTQRWDRDRRLGTLMKGSVLHTSTGLSAGERRQHLAHSLVKPVLRPVGSFPSARVTVALALRRRAVGHIEHGSLRLLHCSLHETLLFQQLSCQIFEPRPGEAMKNRMKLALSTKEAAFPRHEERVPVERGSFHRG